VPQGRRSPSRRPRSRWKWTTERALFPGLRRGGLNGRPAVFPHRSAPTQSIPRPVVRHSVGSAVPLRRRCGPVDERDLITRVLAGEAEAERRLYDSCVDRAGRTTRRVAGDRERGARESSPGPVLRPPVHSGPLTVHLWICFRMVAGDSLASCAASLRVGSQRWWWRPTTGRWRWRRGCCGRRWLGPEPAGLAEPDRPRSHVVGPMTKMRLPLVRPRSRRQRGRCFSSFRHSGEGQSAGS